MFALPSRLRSFWVKLAAAGLLFAIVPALVYQQLAAAEDQRKALLLRLIQEQGRFAGEAVAPLLERFSPGSAGRLAQAVSRLGENGLSIKVLFRPTGAPTFLLVASAPETRPAEAQAAMDSLAASGALKPLLQSCDGNAPLALRLPASATPSGERGELLTYMTPFATPAGCWVTLTAQSAGTLAEQSIGRAYWQAPEVRAAAAIYLLMAVLVMSIFTDAWRNLRHFRAVAGAMVRGEGKVSFAAGNRVPELAEVAADFDAMVAALRRSEALLRQAAEENAHALKAPLAVISQSLEPLRRALPAEDARARRALDLIGQSLERLDGLVSVARRIDEAIAGLMDCPRARVDLSALLERVARGYARLAAERSVGFDLTVGQSVVVAGSEEMLETIAENLLDNALDFAPAGTRVAMRLEAAAGRAVLCVADQGPGVPEDALESIFERYRSQRDDSSEDHYGLGLWIVRRNAEAMGGRAWAEHAPGGGLAVTVSLPVTG